MDDSFDENLDPSISTTSSTQDAKSSASVNGKLGAFTNLFQSITGMGAAFSSAMAMKAQGEYQATMFNENAKLANYQATDAINRGNLDAAKEGTKTANIVGEQRASYGAQGVDVNTGSAAQIQADTNHIGAVDALTIKNNAWREAWGFKTQAMNYQNQGEIAKATADNSAASSLVTGGLKGIGYGLAGAYKWGQSTKPTSGGSN